MMTELEIFWQAHQRARDHSYQISPEDLLNKAFGYFQWIDDHPLQEEVLGWHKGEANREIVDKKRPYTIMGLAAFTGFTSSRLQQLAAKDEYADVMAFIREVIATQQFDGTATGFFKESVMIRHMGLVDKKEVTGADGGPFKTEAVLSPAELEVELARRGIPKATITALMGGADDLASYEIVDDGEEDATAPDS